MNRSFRSIWNEALGAWVAASEVCSARGKKSSSATLGAVVLATAAFGGASSAWAANECGAVVSGDTVTCQGDGTPVGDANLNTTGIAYGTDNIKVVADGTAGAFTIAPTNSANGIFSTGSGSGDQQIEINGPVKIDMPTPPVNPVWAVLARTMGGSGSASAIVNGAQISTVGDNASGVATIAFGDGNATSILNSGSITTTGAQGLAVALFAETRGIGTATATINGGSISTGTSPADGSHAAYALARGTGNAVATMTGGKATTQALNNSVVVAQTLGSGTASATISGGTATTNGASAAIVAVVTGTGNAIASQTGGTVIGKGAGGGGLAASNSGTGPGSANASMTGGSITMQGVGGYGVLARNRGTGAATASMDAATSTITTLQTGTYGIYSAITNAANTATAATTLLNGSISTAGADAHGLYSQTDGTGLAQVTMAGGTVAATGLNADGVRATSTGGTYQVDVTGGSLTSGSGTAAAAIHTLAAAGGTVNIGAAAVVNGAASGIAIRDGDAAGTGTDTLGGNAVVTTAGTVTGDAILGLGNDSLALTGGSFSGNIYGDDRTASAADGNDSFTWTGGTLAGGFYGQNGSDTALVSAPAYNGSIILDGGDDVSAADGWVDRLTLQGVTATAGGDTLRNWETITLDNTRLTLAGAPLAVGSGTDAGGAPMGLFIQPTSSVFMGQPAFTLTGDLHNAGLIDLRNPAGTPGNALTVNGNYAGANGLVRINTALGSDASATDKLVVNGNTSGTTRVLVANTGGAGAATVNGIQVVQVSGTSSEGNFTLAAPVQAGAYEYGLHRGGRTDGDANSFYLSSVYQTPVPIPVPVPGAPAPAPAPIPVPAPEVLRPAVPGYVMGQVATQELGLGLLGTLHQRVGEQQTLKWDHCGCDDKAPADQAWMRLHAQRLDLDGKRQFGFEQEMQFLQLGKDLAVRYSGDAGDKSRSHTGLSVGYGRTSTNFNDRRRGEAGMGYDTGKMKGQMLTLGAYHTRYADNGSYLDLVGQLHAVQNKYTDKYGGEGTQKGTGGGLSVEVGRPWQIGDSQWLIEPQAQLSYQLTRYRGFADNISTVDGFTSQSLRGRLGARLAWNDKAERGEKLTRTNTFYVTANVLHEFKDPKGVTIGNTTTVNEQWAKQTWAELGVGAQLPLSKAAYLYGGVQYQRSLSGKGREGVSGQLGVKVAW